MSNQKKAPRALLWRIVSILVIVLYLIGMVLMILSRHGASNNFGNGVTLWALSTIIGGIALYVKRTNEKKAADEKEFEDAEREYQRRLSEDKQNQEQN